MKDTINTKEDLIAYIEKLKSDKRKISEYFDGERTRESLEADGIFLLKMG
jgi:hypothetical protein